MVISCFDHSCNILRSTNFDISYCKFFHVIFNVWGPLSLVMIIEELFQGNSGSGLENRKLTTVGESLR
jgi:hypothetical protein